MSQALYDAVKDLLNVYRNPAQYNKDSYQQLMVNKLETLSVVFGEVAVVEASTLNIDDTPIRRLPDEALENEDEVERLREA